MEGTFYVQSRQACYLPGPSSLGVPGVPWHTQILADQLTLFQPGGTDYAHLITTGTPGFSDLPTALLTREEKLQETHGFFFTFPFKSLQNFVGQMSKTWQSQVLRFKFAWENSSVFWNGNIMASNLFFFLLPQSAWNQLAFSKLEQKLPEKWFPVHVRWNANNLFSKFKWLI